jgi:hypothetical protein
MPKKELLSLGGIPVGYLLLLRNLPISLTLTKSTEDSLTQPTASFKYSRKATFPYSTTVILQPKIKWLAICNGFEY